MGEEAKGGGGEGKSKAGGEQQKEEEQTRGLRGEEGSGGEYESSFRWGRTGATGRR